MQQAAIVSCHSNKSGHVECFACRGTYMQNMLAFQHILAYLTVLFGYVLQMHGVDWDLLAKEVPTKEKTQIKNYYQNYKQRLELDQIELPLSAKHPKPSRTPSRATTPRPGTPPSQSFSLTILNMSRQLRGLHMLLKEIHFSSASTS